MKTIITFIIVFGILVLVHEFGHYFFARRSGVLVREFAIGMGPKLFSHRDKEGTLYTIRLLPIGGYVRMAGVGEDDTDLSLGMPLSVALNADNIITKINTSKKVQLTQSIPLELSGYDLEKELYIKGFINGDNTDEVVYQVAHDATIIEEDGTEVRIAPTDVQFQSAKVWQRILTNFAGPMSNFILAIVLFTICVFMQGGVPYSDTNTLGAIQKGGAAATAGLKEDDQVISIDGKAMTKWADIQKIISENPEKELTFAVQRSDQTKKIKVTPKAEKNGKETIGMIGIAQPMKTGLGDKLIGGLKTTVDNSLNVFKGLGSLFTGFSLNKLGGPVMMYKLSEKASQQGLTTVIFLMAVLSVNLGIINLLPIPALDGGKIILNILEGVRGKPLSQEKEGLLTLVGFGFVMLLMVLVTWNDIQRFFF